MNDHTNDKKEVLPFIQQGSSKLIAVVDDEPDILELVTINLKKSGFKVKGFENAEDYFNFLKEKTPDLLLLDLMLPDADGFEVCKYMKKDEKLSSIPVIMLTARGDEMDKVLGLELGADDYVTKPFSPRELMARVKAVLRRDEKVVKTQKIKIGEILEIDLQKYETYVDGERISLTSTEFRILKLLSERKGWVYARDQILDYLGVQDKGVLDRTVDVHIKNLREKLGPAGIFIKNIRGIGYKLEE
jgi:DNA-binding response OmpR family regulator